MRTGIVLGKFLPLHKGHMFLIDFAQGIVDKLIVLVDNHNSYFLSLEERVNILKKTYPNLDIRPITYETYQEPTESPNFWPFWNKVILDHVPEKIDYIIGSMDYIKELAKNLKIDYIMIDKERTMVDISATKIRDNYNKNWDLIAPESRYLFVKKIALVGGESVGKSTLTKKLAHLFKTDYSKEFARDWIESGNGTTESDFLNIIKGQKVLIDIVTKKANKILFSDTELITTCAWFEFFYGTRNEELIKYAKENKVFDLYLYLPSNTKWEDDIVRYHLNKSNRDDFDLILKKYLKEFNVNVIDVLGSNYEEKFKFMKNEIKKYIGVI